ncbi:MAG: EamA family transporter [Candidatus Marinimicrobia bacterium]|nr:EamA family transporter [Candidatus Neomarinimicrobiota bacterium]MBT5996535.1 EamA family transporter [Candidatus Neomarinimicrobiota bacterium]MBT6389938.1 EamA family transporter [Candidatus Neomarinimicrobiota bacterium]MBT7973508.1 EamA family transporter [Candidatus Neomarinimicrobiota bacterium]
MNKLKLSGLMHLLIVYIVWGSTYLGIRVAVQEGSGFPPMIMSATRVFAGSLILVALARFIQKQSLRLTKEEWVVLSVSGLALWWGGNGLVAIAEMTVPSGYAALIIACTPIWVAIIESVLDKKRPSVFLVISLLIGVAGIAVLNWPAIIAGNLNDLRGLFLLIIAGLSWGAGSIYQKRKNIHTAPEISSAVQQFTGGIALLITSFIISEPTMNPVPSAWWAWGYLIIFGSVIAFTSFVKALKLLPPNVVFTYAFVNPVVAVILGFFILGEPITPWTFAGATLVIIGVLGVFKEQKNGIPQHD